ncbi:winged helix-turn-helix domain-containing protein [Halapricum desulfuricans]|uniref:Transcriptional regulator, MarR family n=1 Tax=Halapricum desulfuricans TaxID=2841257 RepID=A0A897N3R0_9EURY|nr:winged helix-turn-helix domain-containing protein [Halapricum desulfuricans]QSG05923.1 Transcriptional regulator, MarR family [Halapricum desulfuricans]
MSNEDDEFDWLTEMDKEILNVLGTDLTLTPSVIAENINRSQKGVGNRLSALQAGGLVEKVKRGKYKITEKGLEVAGGEWFYVTTLEGESDHEMAIKLDEDEDITDVTSIEGREVYIRRTPEEGQNEENTDS